MTSGKTTDSAMLRDFALYRQLFSGYVWRYRKLFLMAVGLMLSAALTNLGLASLIKPLTEEVITAPDVHSYGIPILIIFAVLLRALCTSLGESATQSVSLRITRDLRHDLFARLLYLPIGHFDQVQSGSLIARFTNETTTINRCVADTISILFKDIPTIIVLVAFMIYSNWLFAIIALLSAPAITFTLLRFRQFLRKAHHEIQDLTGAMIAAADQALAAARIVRVYGGQATERERFDRIIRDHYRSSVRATRGALLSRFLLQAMLCIPILMLIVLVVVYSQSSIGDLLSFFVVFLMLVPPVRKLSMVNAALQQVLAALESIQAVMQQPLERDDGTLSAAGSRGTLQMRNVSFRYPRRDAPALQEVNLHIRTGETVALVGASGSGKSTLVNLLCRFYDPTSGSIELDGHDVRDYTLESYRQQLAVVSQEVVLFNDTVRNNVAYGITANCSQQALQQAIQAACVDEFLQRLPDDMDSAIGKDGMLLSGGQRQRIAIARALLKDAPVLILDEATSALDSASERYVRDAVHNAGQHRTCIIIAHRATTVEGAPRILVLQQGRLVGNGKHQELLAECAEYRRLFAQLQVPEAAD